MDYKAPSHPPGFGGRPLREIAITKGPAHQDSLTPDSPGNSELIFDAQILESRIRTITQTLNESGITSTPPSLIKAITDLGTKYQEAGIGVIRGDAPEDGTAEIITGKPLAQKFADAVRTQFKASQI